ncbi:MAG: sigma-54 dependent transcriptional regulator [Tannerella sp.]|jgi:two-component system response regulator HydG|nr:sigma-54 dependent transcriptional regulator [Tannerella sp.]
MNKQHILLVEDDASFGIMLRSWFEKKGYTVDLCICIKDAQKMLDSITYSLVLTDLRLPDGDGIMLLTWIKEHKMSMPVIIMTSYAGIQSAVSAIKIGAFDYLEKPINPSVLQEKVGEALKLENQVIQSEEEYQSEKTKGSNSNQFVYGKSPAAQTILENIQIVAPTKMAVLIMGESGTGKEYAARMIHQYSRRKDAPFIALDCGSLSRELAPSELFGHLKGAFTSAVSDKKGVFEIANKGTVFLDEIGNLSYDVQIQLLRVLQEFKVRPVGDTHDIEVDVRIIVATNEDLQKAITEGRFREDLYHRLNEFNIVIPPLRERSEDIPQFINLFIEQANQELEKEVSGCCKDALSVLKQFQWRGNLRELRNVIRRAVLFARTDEITLECLPDSIFEEKDKENNIALFLIENEKERIQKALEISAGNKAAAARLLKIDRKTLYNKISLYNLDIDK